MSVNAKDVTDLLNIILVYVPAPYARQLIGDMARSYAADHDPAFDETMQLLTRAYNNRYGRPFTEAAPAPVKEWFPDTIVGRRVDGTAITAREVIPQKGTERS